VFSTKAIRGISVIAISTIFGLTLTVFQVLPSYAEGVSTTASSPPRLAVRVASGHAAGAITFRHPQPAAVDLPRPSPSSGTAYWRSPDPAPTKLASGQEFWHKPPSPAQEMRVLHLAKEDLAARIGIPPDQIEVLQVRSVTWADSSLGHPRNGAIYAQMVTPGYTILLQVADKTYVYHTDTGHRVVYCQES